MNKRVVKMDYKTTRAIWDYMIAHDMVGYTWKVTKVNLIVTDFEGVRKLIPLADVLA